MTRERAVEIAAQLWCEPQHEKKEMDVAFAESIVAALIAAAETERIETIKEMQNEKT